MALKLKVACYYYIYRYTTIASQLHHQEYLKYARTFVPLNQHWILRAASNSLSLSYSASLWSKIGAFDEQVVTTNSSLFEIFRIIKHSRAIFENVCSVSGSIKDCDLQKGCKVDLSLHVYVQLQNGEPQMYFWQSNIYGNYGISTQLEVSELISQT